MSMSHRMGRMAIGGEKRRFSSSDEEDPQQPFKKNVYSASFPAQQMRELQYQLGRAGSALKAANKVSMNIGWGPIIPQTPAVNQGNGREIPKPFSSAVGGVTPVHGGGAGSTVTISKEEYDRLLRNNSHNNGKRSQEKEGEREMGQNGDGREEGNRRNIREVGSMRRFREEGNMRNRKEEGYMRNRREEENMGKGREEGRMRRNGVGNEREKGYWGKESGYDEVRHLEGLCGRCGEDHATRDCSYNKEELVCEYKPCISKQGHTIQVCHELMKRCRLPVCDGQRGHRVKSHFRPDGVMPFGKDRRSAQELKRHFEDATIHLTVTEKRLIQRYESRQDRLAVRDGAAGEGREAQNEEEGIEMTVFKNSEVELLE